MMVRAKFLDWSAGVPEIASLAAAMLKEPFDMERGTGFSLDEVRPRSIKGRYVRRENIIEDVFQPDGSTVEVSRAELRIVRFRATPGAAGLMLVDAPRSLAEFKARLSVLSGHSLTIAPTRVPLAVFQAALAKEFGYCVVTSATFRDITLAGNSTAALVVRAKSNAVDAGLALLGQRTRVLSRLEMTFPRREYCLRVRASIGGSLAISGGLEADIGAIASVLQTTVGARDLGTA